jgi:pilus assembly protein CpaB
MSIRMMIILLVAGLVAFGAATLVRSYVSGSASDTRTQNKKVLVAATDIAQGAFVRADQHLQWVEWPEATLNTSFLIEGAADQAQYNGSVARRALLKGEPVTDAILVKASEGGFMAAVLKPGMRAISIAVDSTSGNAGFIFPGDRVDLMITHSVAIEDADARRAEEILASETFIEDVRVLAADQQVDNPENTAILAKTVTLEVSQRQAEAINVAKDLGKISLSLRSLASQEPKPEAAPQPHATRDSDISSILAPRAASAAEKVMVIRGSTREELEFGQ